MLASLCVAYIQLYLLCMQLDKLSDECSSDLSTRSDLRFDYTLAAGTPPRYTFV